MLASGKVINCTIVENGSHGIHAGLEFGGLIKDNSIRNNGGDGFLIQFGGGFSVIHNEFSSNAGPALNLDGVSGYSQNLFLFNNGGGAEVVGGVSLGQNLCSGVAC